MVKKTETTRVLMMTCKNGEIKRIEIPSTWAVTYGPVAVGAKNFNGESPNVLRIYRDTSRKDLVAVFKDVHDFVDSEVAVSVKIVKAKTKVFRNQGEAKDEVYTGTVTKTVWRDPFADTQEDEDDDLVEEMKMLT